MFSAILAATAVAATAPPVVRGDFDHDGRLDSAEVVPAPQGHQLIVRRAADPSTPAVVTTLQSNALGEFYVQVIGPGSRRTACGKGVGRRDHSCRPRVELEGQTLAFGTREASELVAVWTGARFEVIALSD